ncbi:PREDICTED: protein trichome birefringence-like 18 [Camelina sativa]|uniref:Protein trichome birefringence-like 18 n=1 Tax=Camelina sativa TaxID=90675 RepID=A0ABM0TZG9_CAMSA|nr:PREDICTED: protein trichome birefringence-like 18 [Camelina sativa]
MAFGSPRNSIFAAGFPRKVSTIAIAIGGLASFFVFGLLLRLSYPNGSSVGGVFYGIGTPEQVEVPLILSNHTVKGLQKSSDIINAFDSNPTPDSSSGSPGDVSKNLPPPDFDGGRQVEKQPLTQEKEDKVSLDTTEKINVPSDEGEANDTKAEETPSSSSSPPHDDDSSETASPEPECDLYQGSWFYDPGGPLYTNNSCPVLTQMQNCQGNGRPDKGYENWRWKPSQCDLPRFDARKFLELMRHKTLAFIGDSVARNQMESMLCLLWQVETPVNRGSRKMQRWYFKKSSVMIARIWSSWLVHQFNEKFDYAPEGVTKLKLDLPDERIMEAIPKFDVVVLSSGHWFAKQSVYILKDEIVGGQLWWPDKSKPMKVNNVDAFGISVETILKSMATHPNYSGLTIVRTFSPDHYEGGAWNTGGSCTGKEEPIVSGKLVKNGFTEIMHEKQATGYNQAVDKVADNLKPKLKLMDITEAFGYRHDGHPGPYRNPDPNKITKRGPDGRPPPQDCLHWCMPGPVDTWNEMVLELIRRDLEGRKRKSSST